MKKLLLAAALFTSVANAQFIEQVSIDPMTDKPTYFSEVQGEMNFDGRPATGRFMLSCLYGETLAVVITSDSIYKNKIDVDTVEVRVLPDDRQYAFDVVTDWGAVYLVNPKLDSIEQLSNSEVRVRYKDVTKYTSYFSFKIPDLTQSEAYKACNTH